MQRWLCSVCGITSGVLVGCVSQLETTQLQGVAKDWSETIRACQVLPVYPLTQDLQPGYVLLVHQTADQEVQSYSSSGGFLPLTQIVTRLPIDYSEFYGRPSPPDKTKTDFQPPGVVFPATQPSDLSGVPRASFPSFGFDVSDQVGASASFPVHGIPVGLTLLGSGSAHGLLSFTGAYTYGIDLRSLDSEVQTFVKDPNNIAYLKKISANTTVKGNDLLQLFAAATDQPTYLRVISRVYMVTDINISLTASQSGGGGGTVGIPKQLDLSNTNAGSAEANVTAINTVLKSSSNAGVGGSTTIGFATSRSVSMDEHFDKPMVVGYLAVDYEFNPDNGTLQNPLPTLFRLNEKIAGLDVKQTAK